MPAEDLELAERSAKSPSAFRTISEVAEELDVAQHVLRFWEGKFPQVKPLKRGGGRRYYRPEDIETLKEIRTLLYRDGYTIKGAQKLLRQKRSKPNAGQKAETVAETPDIPDSFVADEPTVEDNKKPADLQLILKELKEARARLGAILQDVD